MKALSNGPHIFNLGHGITPDADPDNVQIMARERSLPIRFELFGRRVFSVGYTADCPAH